MHHMNTMKGKNKVFLYIGPLGDFEDLAFKVYFGGFLYTAVLNVEYCLSMPMFIFKFHFMFTCVGVN